MGDSLYYGEEGVVLAPRQPWWQLGRTQKNVYPNNQDIEEQNKGMRNDFDRFINPKYKYISGNRLPERQDVPEDL
jgi:hypothetical protein